MSLLEINNLSIGFKKIIAQNISAQLNEGSLTVLMGVNGAGKSCFLKTISHLIPAISGEIKIKGKSVRDYTPIELAQFTSIVLTEKFHVDFLRVDELIALGRSPYTGWSGELHQKDHDVITQTMRQAGIESLKERFFTELSDGQKQKVLIARALAQEPKLLILDEPTTYLDIPSKLELMKLLKKIAKENNVAVLMSTHDLDLAEKYADQIWLMGKEGSFQVGNPTELASAGTFKKHFFYND